MSTVHILLYAFVAIIILLCLLSAAAYLFYECKDICPQYTLVNKRKLVINENQQLLENRVPEVCNDYHHTDDTARLVHVQPKQDTRFELALNRDEQDNQGIVKEESLQASHITPIGSQRNETNIKNPQVKPQIVCSNDTIKQTSTSAFNTDENIQEMLNNPDRAQTLSTRQKPPIAVKPLIHSLPSSQRNSFIRDTDFSPMKVVANQPESRSNSLHKSLKPKAPPPPPPPTYSDNLTDFPPPPPYLSTISPVIDLPAENYLSDE